MIAVKVLAAIIEGKRYDIQNLYLELWQTWKSQNIGVIAIWNLIAISRGNKFEKKRVLCLLGRKLWFFIFIFGNLMKQYLETGSFVILFIGNVSTEYQNGAKQQ